MPPASKLDDREPPIVTWHAVTRYVQRVLGIVVEWAAPPLRPSEIAEAHCLTAGASIDDIRRRILTPTVAAAIKLGLPFINAGDFSAVLRDGRVITVKPPCRSIMNLQIRSRSESKRISRQHARRRRRHRKLGLPS